MSAIEASLLKEFYRNLYRVDLKYSDKQ